jgi:hypothetical protein
MVERRTEVVQEGDGAQPRAGGCGHVGGPGDACGSAQQPVDRAVLRIRIEDRESAVVADVQFEMRVLSDALQRLCALYFSTGVHRNRSLEKAAR